MTLPRITCTVRAALEASGLGRTKLYELMADGSLDSVKIGSRRLVLVESLRHLLTHACTHVPNATRGEQTRKLANIEAIE
jgi:hypothetical protein